STREMTTNDETISLRMIPPLHGFLTFDPFETLLRNTFHAAGHAFTPNSARIRLAATHQTAGWWVNSIAPLQPRRELKLPAEVGKPAEIGLGWMDCPPIKTPFRRLTAFSPGL